MQGKDRRLAGAEYPEGKPVARAAVDVAVRAVLTVHAAQVLEADGFDDRPDEGELGAVGVAAHRQRDAPLKAFVDKNRFQPNTAGIALHHMELAVS